jgi:hypothetical protein
VPPSGRGLGELFSREVAGLDPSRRERGIAGIPTSGAIPAIAGIGTCDPSAMRAVVVLIVAGCSLAAGCEALFPTEAASPVDAGADRSSAPVDVQTTDIVPDAADGRDASVDADAADGQPADGSVGDAPSECTPESVTTACGSAVCGPSPSSCGAVVDCGTCGSGASCMDGVCCAEGTLAVGACACKDSNGNYSDSWFGIAESNCPSQVTACGGTWSANQFSVSPVALPGMVPLTRCVYSDSNSDLRWFLTDEACTALLPQSAPDGTGPEAGVLGFVYPSPKCGAGPLYRYYDATWQNRWSTLNPSAPSNQYGGQAVTGYGWP